MVMVVGGVGMFMVWVLAVAVVGDGTVMVVTVVMVVVVVVVCCIGNGGRDSGRSCGCIV